MFAYWAHSMGSQRTPLSRVVVVVVIVVVVDIDAQAACDATVATPGEWQYMHAAARSGEWAQHFSNASCRLTWCRLVAILQHLRLLLMTMSREGRSPSTRQDECQQQKAADRTDDDTDDYGNHESSTNTVNNPLGYRSKHWTGKLNSSQHTS